MDLAYIPSPSTGEWNLGPIPIRGYALCIILGVIAAIWIAERRWAARGGERGTISDTAVWAVPFGIVGARIYHVITTPGPYFGEGGEPLDAFKIWEGGIGIWGAITFGALGAWIACKRRGIPLPAVADVAAPGIAVAQGIGRWGNWFNQELYGRPTDLPWALEIDLSQRVEGYDRFATFHPTFLYESLWVLALAVLLIWLDRRYPIGHGRLFALYVMGYTAGRAWIEYLRIDEAHEFFGLRVNDWVSGAVFAGALAYFLISLRRRPGREEIAPAVVEPEPVGELDATLAGGPAAESLTETAGSISEEPAPEEATMITGERGQNSDTSRQ